MRGDFPGQLGSWKSTEEILQILRDLEMRQAIYAPVFEGPDQSTSTSGMKTKILQSITGTWYVTLVSRLGPVMG